MRCTSPIEYASGNGRQLSSGPPSEFLSGHACLVKRSSDDVGKTQCFCPTSAQSRYGKPFTLIIGATADAWMSIPLVHAYVNLEGCYVLHFPFSFSLFGGHPPVSFVSSLTSTFSFDPLRLLFRCSLYLLTQIRTSTSFNSNPKQTFSGFIFAPCLSFPIFESVFVLHLLFWVWWVGMCIGYCGPGFRRIYFAHPCPDFDCVSLCQHRSSFLSVLSSICRHPDAAVYMPVFQF